VDYHSNATTEALSSKGILAKVLFLVKQLFCYASSPNPGLRSPSRRRRPPSLLRLANATGRVRPQTASATGTCMRVTIWVYEPLSQKTYPRKQAMWG